MTDTAACDLCGLALRGRWHRFDAHQIAPTLQGSHLGTGVTVIGHWAVCPACARLITNRAFTALAHRISARATPDGLDYDGEVRCGAAFDVAELCVATLPANLTGPRANGVRRPARH